MTDTRFAFAGAVALTICLAGTACDSSTGPVEFPIAVTSIVAPAEIAPATELSVRFLGNIGPDQCSRLKDVNVARSPGSLVVSFRGERVSGGLCAQMPAALDHVETVAPPLQDPFTIRVVQPDGSFLEEVVQVQGSASRAP